MKDVMIGFTFRYGRFVAINEWTGRVIPHDLLPEWARHHVQALNKEWAHMPAGVDDV